MYSARSPDSARSDSARSEEIPVPASVAVLKGVDRDDSGSASGIYQAMQQIGGSVGLAILVSIAVGHGQSAALEGAAGFAALAFVLTAVALFGQAAHRREVGVSAGG
jgi:hypothetical protein